MWAVCLLIATVWCFYLISDNIMDYISYPVTTKIRYISEESSIFPVIGFCNTNPITTKFGVDFLDKLIRYKYPNETMADDDTETDFLHRVYIKNLYDIKSTISYNTSSDLQQRLGLNLEDMLINCYFGDEACNMSEFTWFFNWNYGNCFMFDTQKKIYSEGRSEQLTLEFFIGFEKIVPALSYASGLQLMILNRSDNKEFNYYFESYSAKPNTHTTFIIQRSFVNKLPNPFSECSLDLRTNNNRTVDSKLYRWFFEKNLTYSRFFCLRNAYRINTYLKCNCVLEINDVPGVANICTSEEELECDRISFYEDFIKHSFYGKFNADCPQECNTVNFDIAINSQNFPTDSYARKLLKFHPYFNRLKQTDNITVQDVQESVLRVNIYYGFLGYTNLEEIATYTFNDMIGNTGGMLGLFLGVSLISFVEILELTIEILIILMFKPQIANKK